MAFHGIVTCLRSSSRWFGGVVCTDGVGSPRNGIYQHLNDGALRILREKEQRAAARIGQYSFVTQLSHKDSAIEKPLDSPLVDELVEILTLSRPEVIYTHNPADKHPTHVRVLVAVLEALRRMPVGARPQFLFGCEMWRGLDWMSDHAKNVMDVGGFASIAEALNRFFDTQIKGGKRFDLAVMGRRRANAAFFNGQDEESVTEAIYAMDLSSLIGQPPQELREFTHRQIESFHSEVLGLLETALT